MLKKDESSGGLYRRWLTFALRLSPLVTVFIVQGTILGWKSAALASPAVAVAFLGMWFALSARERKASRMRPTDSLYSIPAVLLLSSSPRDFQTAITANSIYKRWRYQMTRGEIGGILDLSPDAIRWRPGSLAKRWRMSPLTFQAEQISSLSLEPRVPGLGRLAVFLWLTLQEGTKVCFATRNAKGLIQHMPLGLKKLMRPQAPRAV
jgi:hypothetical protein